MVIENKINKYLDTIRFGSRQSRKILVQKEFNISEQKADTLVEIWWSNKLMD